MPRENLKIESLSGAALSGALELPTGLVRGAALFAHCFTCTKSSKAAVAVSRALAKEGIATLRFDFTGLGGSEGEFGRAGFATDVDDLVASANYLVDRFGLPILLIGHSLGGAAVLAAADDIGTDNVAAIATIGAPSDVPHVLHRIDGDLDAIRQNGQGKVSIGGREFDLGKEFIEKVEGVDLLDQVKRLRKPMLFMHSPTDDTVSVDHAGALFGAAKHPKSFVSLDGADHLLLNEVDAQFASSVIASWAQRYMPLHDDWPMPQDGVVVRTGQGNFGTEIHTTSHHLVADEPKSYGGEDTGPTPYDLVLAGLGACSSMTMMMYARRKEWPLEGASIHLTHERDHHEDCDHCEDEGETARIQAIHRSISLTGDQLSDEQRAKIIEIADKCPVHKTLEGHLHVHTEAVD